MSSSVFILINWLSVLTAFVFMYFSTKKSRPAYRFGMRTLMALCLLIVTVAVSKEFS